MREYLRSDYNPLRGYARLNARLLPVNAALFMFCLLYHYCAAGGAR